MYSILIQVVDENDRIVAKESIPNLPKDHLIQHGRLVPTLAQTLAERLLRATVNVAPEGQKTPATSSEGIEQSTVNQTKK